MLNCLLIYQMPQSGEINTFGISLHLSYFEISCILENCIILIYEPVAQFTFRMISKRAGA